MGVFRRVRKTIAKSDYQRRHVCLSVRPHELIVMKFHTGNLLLNPVGKFQVSLKADKNNGHFT